MAGSEGRNAIAAFDLAQYLCDRLEPDATRSAGWLRRIIMAFSRDDLPEDRRTDVAAAICLLHVPVTGRPSMRAARHRLIALGFEVEGDPPALKGVAGFACALGIDGDLSAFWEQAKAVRTMGEQTTAYLAALADGRASDGYPDLAGVVSEWPTLEKAIVDASARQRVHVLTGSSEACPIHYRTLPSSELSKSPPLWIRCGAKLLQQDPCAQGRLDMKADTLGAALSH